MHEANRLPDLRHENTGVGITGTLHTNEESGYSMPCNIAPARSEIVCLAVARYSSLPEGEMDLPGGCQDHIKYDISFMKHLVECDT